MWWKKHQRHPRQKVYLVRNMSGSNSCYTYKKTIYDIGTEILKFQCLNCFKTRLFCKSIIPEDSKISRRDLSFASVKSRFKAIFKKSEFFDLVWNLPNFRLQYFSCLPLKISSSEFHSILKMISASRRIFFEKLPNFRLQYFSCLPLKISSSEFHSILKMISASRRIFFEKLPNFRI